MRFLVTGATGLVGRELCKELLLNGHDVHILSRSNNPNMSGLPVTAFPWQDPTTMPPREAFEGVDGIVNLMGEPILGGIFTKTKQKSMEQSRVDGTLNIAKAVREYGLKLKTYVGASAVGFYEFGQHPSSETSSPGMHPLAELCKSWESAHRKIEAENHSIVRIGCVLSSKAKIIQAAVNSLFMHTQVTMGSRDNKLSWIHLKDLVSILLQCSEGKLSGIINGVAPKSVTNEDLNNKLRQHFTGPILRLKAPRWAIRLVAGPPSDILLNSQDVIPQKLIDVGFGYSFPDIDSAVTDCLNLSINPKTKQLEPCFEFETHQYIERSREEIWPFFSDPHNLEKITPSTLKFRITDMSDSSIKPGCNIQYKLNLRGFPIRWKTLIESFTPCEEFVDTQLEGPYRVWHHTHTFKPCGNGTLMTDRVKYQIPMKPIGLVALPFVTGDIRKIFSFRRTSIFKYI